MGSHNHMATFVQSCCPLWVPMRPIGRSPHHACYPTPEASCLFSPYLQSLSHTGSNYHGAVCPRDAPAPATPGVDKRQPPGSPPTPCVHWGRVWEGSLGPWEGSASTIEFPAPSCFSIDVLKGEAWARLSGPPDGLRLMGCSPHPAARHRASGLSRRSI